MNLFGLTISRNKQALTPREKAYVGPMTYSPTGPWSRILEPFTGAWQRNIEIDRADVLTYSTVWACLTLIASDIAKIGIKLIELDRSTGIWTEIENPAYSPVLRKPNHYQTRVKFIEYWIICKLLGNAYILKERDSRGVVSALYVLDPQRVKVLIADNGEVFYELAADYLSGLNESSVRVPASEIIHDIMVPLYHPLVGVSPIYACGLAATQGLKIQRQSAKMFANGSQVQGVLTAPAMISNETAKRIQEHWETNYTGEASAGKVAVLGDGLHFEAMSMTAVNAQLIEQLGWTSEQICAVFHVPGYMVGIGPPPPYTDIQSINLQYYTQALQNPIENLELLLDEGLSLPSNLGIELDVDGLARMDTKTQTDISVARVGAGILSPNEARSGFSLKPVTGGDTPYMQQQNYSLSALHERDLAGPPKPPTPAPTPPPSAEPMPEKDTEVSEHAAILSFTTRAKAMGLPVAA